MNNGILNKALEFIQKNDLISKKECIIAGVSGGADSIGMLMILLELREQFENEIIVAHVNHGIRGKEAKRDAEFVRMFCLSHSVPFELAEADIPKMARKTGTTCEEAGRNFRYEYFCTLAEKYGTKKIAVAHNSGDNAETVLFNIFRGSGINGIKGILPKRPIKDYNGREYILIRPLLSLSRKEIESYLGEKEQDYCIDSTNNEDGYSRNIIRNSILPLAVRSINSGVEQHIASLSAQAGEVMDFIASETEKNIDKLTVERDAEDNIISVKINGLEIKKLHSVVRRNLIRKAFELAASRLKDVEENHILSIEELFEKQSGKKIDLPYDITAIKEYDDIILTKEEKNPELGDDRVSLKVYDRLELPDKIPTGADEKWFDYDKLSEEPVIRAPLKGDYLMVGKGKYRKKLSRLLIDNKIPLKDRDSLALLAEGNHVLWVVDVRQDESCYVTEETTRVLVAKKI